MVATAMTLYVALPKVRHAHILGIYSGRAMFEGVKASQMPALSSTLQGDILAVYELPNTVFALSQVPNHHPDSKARVGTEESNRQQCQKKQRSHQAAHERDANTLRLARGCQHPATSSI